MDDTNTLHLPLEIIETVLSKSPSVKSLFRFKSVSKSWNNMISDPAFVRNHHERSKDSNSQALFLRKRSAYDSEGFSLVKLDDRKLHNIRVLGSPDGLEHVLCFCKGLLLVSERLVYPWSIALWNPSTGEKKRLSVPYRLTPWNCGLCHDPNTDDSKVVILDLDYFYVVYSFKNNSWKKKRIKHECSGLQCRMPNPSGVCVDGASYRVWSNERITRIIYFDPRDDSSKILHTPENVDDRLPIYLVGLGGCLCLYCNGRDETTVWIWTKEKGIDNNSWKTLMVVENVGMPIEAFQPQCFVGNKIVIRNIFNSRLSVYNPFDKRFEQFESEIEVFGIGLVPYVDSPFIPSSQQGMHN